MGLDNIPHNYPCKTGGTAVMVERKNVEGQPILNEDGTVLTAIDCGATQAWGGCPWKNANPPEGGVLGMFGTDCWYRGKYGNYLLEKYATYDETTGSSFYGSNAEGDYKSAGECEMLADEIDDAILDWDWDRSTNPDAADDRAALQYASWWLRWVAEHADGSDCWY